MLEEYQSKQQKFYNFFTKLKTNDNISHAYLIETNGVDYGFDLALSLAKYFLCKKEENHEICGDCNICRLVDNDNYPDIEIIEDADSIKKEQMIELQRKFLTKPLYGKYRIYIIKDASLLNKSSANTILKFLEEPGEDIIAILLATNSNVLLDTIVSRCNVLSLVGAEENQLVTIFKKYCEITENFEEFMNSTLKELIDFYMKLESKGTQLLLSNNVYLFKDNLNLLFNIGLYFYYDVLNNILERPLKYFDNYSEVIIKISKINEIDDIIYKIDILNRFMLNSNYNVSKEMFIDNFIISIGGVL